MSILFFFDTFKFQVHGFTLRKKKMLIHNTPNLLKSGAELILSILLQ